MLIAFAACAINKAKARTTYIELKRPSGRAHRPYARSLSDFLRSVRSNTKANIVRLGPAYYRPFRADS